MEDLTSVVDWSRLQFAVTAAYHWLFVPLTLGLGLIVAIMETIYYRTNSVRWLNITKFWMTLFGINFALGVATGIILEFEFGTNWSNYSWFVGDIFGAPLAIEGLFAFFMEATFIAVMFFGWKKVSRRFHLAATWLTAIGATVSALWILVANAWMQYPAGMEFDPDQMRNVMANFWEVIFSPVAINKFFHAVTSGWALGGVFVVGVAGWFLLKRRNVDMALDSIKVGGTVGLVGLLLTMATGHGSAVEVARHQPMKLAAMEGLYEGNCGQSIVAFGILNPAKTVENSEDPFLFEISVPKGLSLLVDWRDPDKFIPGISDLVEGREKTVDGQTLKTVSYQDRIDRGLLAHDALRRYDAAKSAGDTAAMAAAHADLKQNYDSFGFGYFNNPAEAVPPVALTFYSFHIMVIAGGVLLLFLVVALFATMRRRRWMTDCRWMQWAAMLMIPIVYVCSQSGWIVAEVGRQPWIIQDIMPTKAAISAISAGSVQLTFWIFVVVFTALLAAEISIMLKQIKKGSETDYLTPNE
ncbi:MAG: cytochrome ubiquinol oxidase subunit I [Muribaculaceae bacterium]|nr:cytochrome ubiquinol oxidase subunit I [Muribaculaceae bacterium]